jgi:flagellar L-ring protein precursor FlgH
MMTPFDPLFDAALHAAARRHCPRPGLGLKLLAVLAVPALITAGLLVAAPPARPCARPATGYEPSLPDPPAAKPADGGILNLTSGYAGLVEGARAHRGTAGDRAGRTAHHLEIGGEQDGKSSSFSSPPQQGPLSLPSNGINNSGASAFSGKGNASQTSSLGGEVSVTIAEVRRNGTVLVRGNKRLLLSQGQEWVQFSGIVRLADIDTPTASSRARWPMRGSPIRAAAISAAPRARAG